MGRRPRQKKVNFELKAVDRIVHRTRDPKPTARVNKPYVQPKPTFQGGRYVLRTKKFVQLETQREIKGTINRVLVIQGQSGLLVHLYFNDGTIQQL